MCNKLKINFQNFLICSVIFIGVLTIVIFYAFPNFKEIFDLFFNGVVSVVTILYVIITFKILQENQKLREQQVIENKKYWKYQDNIKKKEIISLLHAYFNKFGKIENLVKNTPSNKKIFFTKWRLEIIERYCN